MIKMLSKINTYVFFIVFLFVAIVSVIIKIGNYGIWIPSICVLLYGLILLLFQVRNEKILLDQEKDSPYFMGFMLTLIALLYVFISNSNNTDNNSFHQLFESIGIAISTTIVGLFCRYLIVITDKNEKREKTLLKLLAEEQEKTLVSYLNANERLHKMISSFTENHQKIIEEEFVYHNKYIENINKFNTGLDSSYDLLMKSFKEKVETINKHSSDFGNALSGFYAVLKSNSERIIEMQTSFEKSLEDHFDELKSNKLKNAISELNKSIIDTNNNYNEIFKNLKDKIESSDIEQSLNKLSSSIQEINSNILKTIEDQNRNSNLLFEDLENQMRNSVKSIKEMFEDVLTDAHNFGNIIKSTDTKIIESIENISSKISESIESNNNEINKKIQENLINFQKQFSILSENINSFGELLKTKGNDVELSIDNILEKMKNGIINTDNDLKLIDKLLTDFINIIQKNHISKIK